jgi:predicted porin
MKKLVIAAAMTAMATVASAQNVSVYGVIDTGFQNYNTGATTLTRATDGILATSRLGFKGTEDLGGGLTAGFVLEGKVVPSAGTFGSTSSTGQIFDRESSIFVAGKFGEIRAGKMDVSAAEGADTLASQAGNLGFHASNGTGIELGSDTASTIRYTTPKFSNFSAQIGRSTNANGSTTDAGTEITGYSVTYDDGKLKLLAGQAKLNAATTVAKRDFTAYGAAYNFGAFSVGGSYATGDVSTTGDVKSTVKQASVRVPLGAGLAAHGVYAITKDGTQASAGEGKGYTLAVTKALSKRTTVYAAYTSITNEANATMSMVGTTAGTAGLDPKATTVGISHTF